MNFESWLDEQEGFGIRIERMLEDLSTGKPEMYLKWLRAAYNVGYDAGQEAAYRDCRD